MVMVLDIRRNMTTKYGTNIFVIRGHYKQGRLTNNRYTQRELKLEFSKRSRESTTTECGSIINYLQ